MLVLNSDSGSPYGVLYNRGRDIEESESAMQFDKDTGRWCKLGTAEDFRRSEERKAVIRVLIDHGRAMAPKDIAGALGKKHGAVRMLLTRMAKATEITALGNGTYLAKD